MTLTGINAISYGKRLFIINQHPQNIPKIQIQRNLKRHYNLYHGHRDMPHHKTILKIINNFKNEGTLHDRRKTIRSKNRTKNTVRTSEFYDKITDIVENKGIDGSYRAIQRELNRQNLKTSPETVRKSLKKLKYKPFKECTCSWLKEEHKEKRCNFCEILLANDGELATKFEELGWFTDETYIEIIKGPNRKNNIKWSKTPPRDHNCPRKAKPDKLMVWIACSKWGFFYKIFRNKTILDSKKYHWLLSHFVFPKYYELTPPEFHDSFIHQEDGAKVHAAHFVSNFLFNKIGGRVCAGRFYDWHQTGINWPPYSPDLSVLDYFLNDRVKNLVHCDGQIQTLAQLEARITWSFTQITQEEVSNAISGFTKRLEQCLKEDGGPFERYRT